MRKHILTILTIIIAFVLDFVTKSLALKKLGYFNKVDFFGGFVRFDLTFNQGGVFGIMQGYKTFFLVISICVLLIMIAYYLYEKNMPAPFSFAMGLIIAGALGNITDRLIPGRIGVVDFISIGVDGVYRWPTFNVADMVIILGAFILAIVVYKEEKQKTKGEEG
ncbi:MAG TPA: signal peptidase II [Spirochaetota bacterium]|jgi:signal peptidase II|nr:signal peptidase II [Spirochaetota bacterium]OQB00265.1 MAG: Lipoprotein signal peptidase [Spirochaetes bacterium ADurb.Bin218]HON16874.1 signal peptidase II [Spirochaetota bacterium]HOQ11767.1 signal peptidase II [Spirochaetota bacterium]HOV09630.1 signal peptidase II [Spirochaetota bacterium]